jgi:hypothetical protein
MGVRVEHAAAVKKRKASHLLKADERRKTGRRMCFDLVIPQLIANSGIANELFASARNGT